MPEFNQEMVIIGILSNVTNMDDMFDTKLQFLIMVAVPSGVLR